MGCAVSRPAYVEPIAPVAIAAPVSVGWAPPAVAVGPSLSINTGYGGSTPTVVRENVYVNKTVNVHRNAGGYGRSFAGRGVARRFPGRIFHLDSKEADRDIQAWDADDRCWSGSVGRNRLPYQPDG